MNFITLGNVAKQIISVNYFFMIRMCENFATYDTGTLKVSGLMTAHNMIAIFYGSRNLVPCISEPL